MEDEKAKGPRAARRATRRVPSPPTVERPEASPAPLGPTKTPNASTNDPTNDRDEVKNDHIEGPRALLDDPRGELSRPKKRERPVVLQTKPTLEALDALIRGLQDKTIDATTLDGSTRRAVVAFLAEGRTPESRDKDGKKQGGKLVTRDILARLLKVTPATISNDVTKIRRAAGARIVKRWGVEAAIGLLEKTAEDCYREARELGDPALAWMIRSNFVKQLKELGAFGAKGEQEGFRVTFETVGPQLAGLTRKLEEAFRPELSGERVVEGQGRTLPLPSMLEGDDVTTGEDVVTTPEAAPEAVDIEGSETEELPPLDVSGDPLA